MINIHFFGKPDSFEIYEGSENGYIKIHDSFIEPEIKVEKNNTLVIQRFIKNGFCYLQVYTFAQSYNSGRGGIVIGVGIKSDKLINLNNYEGLIIILDEFKSKVLNNFEFKEKSLANYFNSFEKNYNNDLQEVSYSSGSIPNSSTQSLLLYLDDINKGIKKLPKEINGLKSIYIVSDLDIFKSNINTSILYENSNKIYTLSNDSKIVEYKEEISTKPKSNKPNHKVDQDEFEIKKLQNDVILLKSKYVSTKNDFQAYKNKTKKRLQILTLISILLFSTTMFLIVKRIDKDKIKENSDTENTDTTKQPVVDKELTPVNITKSPSMVPHSQDNISDTIYIVKKGEGYDAVLNKYNKNHPDNKLTIDQLAQINNIPKINNANTQKQEYKPLGVGQKIKFKN